MEERAALWVGVAINKELAVIAAGGYMVQVLPFASEETISALERTIPGRGVVENKHSTDIE